MLEVVEHDEHALTPQMGHEGVERAQPRLLTQVERVRDGGCYELRIAKAREETGEHPVGVVAEALLAHPVRQLDREARLASPARPGDRQQPRLAQQPVGLGELVLAADKARGGGRQVGIGDGLERRKAFLAQLEQRDRLAEVLQPVRPEPDQLRRSPIEQGCRVR